MAHQERVARIESVDMETGRFKMTLATEGEASDGNILSIAGGQIPKRMPMLISHFNDPTATAGSVIEAEKILTDSPPRLRAVGQIEMGGVGQLSEVRRDIAYMINQGHITGVSIRWDEVDGKPPVRRVNLPSDHPAFVNGESEKSWRKRMGLFFTHWKAMEGSIVALGADPKALIGRSQETSGDVSTFWRSMATDAEQDFLNGKVAALLADLRVSVKQCRDAGADTADLLNAAVDDSDASVDDFEAVEIHGRKFFLPAGAIEEIKQREDSPECADAPVVAEVAASAPVQEPVGPTPSRLTLDVADLLSSAPVDALVGLLSKSLDDYEKRIKDMTQVILDQRTGRISHGRQ